MFFVLRIICIQLMFCVFSYRGRYQDQIFFTWNRSEGELCSALQKFKTQYPNLRCQTLTGSIVQLYNT